MTGVVADASPLIAFQQIRQLPLLQALFATLASLRPSRGRSLPSVPAQPWIVERFPTQPLAPQVLQARLGAGESEAISLALELRADRLFVDEKAARHLAAALGLNVIGTLGVLLAAKRKGLIPVVRPLVEALLESSFWISPQLVERRPGRDRREHATIMKRGRGEGGGAALGLREDGKATLACGLGRTPLPARKGSATTRS